MEEGGGLREQGRQRRREGEKLYVGKVCAGVLGFLREGGS